MAHRRDLLTDLSSSFDRLLSTLENTDFNLPNMSQQSSTSSWTPKIDIVEKNNQYIVYADVPGIDPASIDVSVDNGLLTLKGHRESEKKEEKDNFLRVERSRGSFIRQLNLPDSIDTAKVKAKSQNGVLEITLPKTDKTNTRKIPIEK